MTAAIQSRSGRWRKTLFCCLPIIWLACPQIVAAEPLRTSRTVQVEHVTVVSKKSFDAVKTALEASLPRLNTDYRALLKNGENESARIKLESEPELSIFIVRDHGRLLQVAGQSRKAIQYEIGNPFTASKMTRYSLGAAIYAPLRVLLYENEAGQAVFEYDMPSSLFGQFGDEHVTTIARQLDQSLERVLRKAAE